MATYRCEQCGETFGQRETIAETAKPQCPKCGGESNRTDANVKAVRIARGSWARRSKMSGPWIDVNSGVDQPNGDKDAAKGRAFMRRARDITDVRYD